MNVFTYDLDTSYSDRLAARLWTTEKGDIIPMEDLSYEHLESCIEFIKERGDKCAYGLGGQWLPILEQELNRRSL